MLKELLKETGALLEGHFFYFHQENTVMDMYNVQNY